MKVRYIGDYYSDIIFDKEEEYEVLGIDENGLYKIYVEAYEDWFTFFPCDFEIVGDSPMNKNTHSGI